MTPIGIATVRSTWSTAESTCLLENTYQSRDNITVTVATDITLLILMLVGLLHSRQRNFGIVRYLWVQVGGAMFRRPDGLKGTC